METIIIVSTIAFLVGILVDELIVKLHKSYGTLRIDHLNPQKDIYRIDLDDLDNLSKKKIIILKVDNNANLSQK